MKYRVYASERWTFNQIYKMFKGDVKADLEYNMKSGSVIVDVEEGYDFGDEFDSRDFEDYEIEDTGDENLEEFDVYCDDEEEAERIYNELMEGYDEDSDEYWDFREYLEQLGWDFYDSDVYISSIGVEEYEEFVL
jgi:hypothetical protein